MWLTEKLTRQNQNNVVAGGQVITAGNYGIISAETELREPECVHPFGYYAVAPQGEKIKCLDGVVLGSSEPMPQQLLEGEILISSAGGAYIKLCNDGSVIINGEVINGHQAL